MSPIEDLSVPLTAAAADGNGNNNGNGNGGGSGDGFVAWYVHYRTGKLMIPAEYGYKAWRFGSKKSKKK